jgi:hypothetical protein
MLAMGGRMEGKMQLYRTEASDPKTNAQRNLCGKTHYVDDDTLRWHHSRVLSARPMDGGLLFGIVTSDALNFDNTRRGFRYVIFDLFGTVLDRPDLEHAFTSSEKATKAMWAVANAIDAKAVTLAAIEKAANDYAHEMYELRETVERIAAAKVA